MKSLLLTLSLALLGGSLDGLAEENSSSRHTFGVTFGSGAAEYKGSSADGDGVAHIYSYYHYEVAPHFKLEVGTLAGIDKDDWKCTEVLQDRWECQSNNAPIFNIQANELEYSSLVLAAKGEVSLSKRNSLYGKLGGQYYDYEFRRNNTKLDNDSGFGAIAAAGWQYRWDAGWGANVGYQYMDMGELEVSSLEIGLSYAF